MLLGFPEAEVQQPCLIDSTDSRDRRGLWNSPSWRPGTRWTSWWCSWGGKAVVSFLWGLLLLVWNAEMLKCVEGCMSKRIFRGYHVTMCLIILMVCCWTLSQPIKIVPGITFFFFKFSVYLFHLCFPFSLILGKYLYIRPFIPLNTAWVVSQIQPLTCDCGPLVWHMQVSYCIRLLFKSVKFQERW